MSAAVSASQTAIIGAQQAAARYSRAGGQPRSQAPAALPAATSETGAAAMISAAETASRVSRQAPRAAARTASRLTYRPITGPPPAGPGCAGRCRSCPAGAGRPVPSPHRVAAS